MGRRKIIILKISNNDNSNDLKNSSDILKDYIFCLDINK